MRRRAFTLFAALSLIVFVLSMGLWVRSYFVREDFVRTDRKPPELDAVAWAYGTIAIWHESGKDTVTFPTRWNYLRSTPPASILTRHSPADRVNVHFAGFQVVYMANSSTGQRMLALNVPLWLFLLTAIPPALWWRRRRREAARGFEVAPALAKAD